MRRWSWLLERKEWRDVGARAPTEEQGTEFGVGIL